MTKKKLHTNRDSGFKVPENYFDSIEHKVMSQLQDSRTIEHIDTHGFKVPEGYLEHIDTKILNKVKSESSVIHFKPRPQLYYMVGIAASLLLLFAIFISKDRSEEISAEMVETYFQQSDLDSYELAQLLSEAEILEDDFVIIEATYSEENLESYLLENADLEQFIE